MFKFKKAQNLVEYAIVLGLVAAIAVVVMRAMGTEIAKAGTEAGQNVNNTSTAAGKAWCDSIGGSYAGGTCTPP